MADYLDIVLPIVEKDSNGSFVATTYFEDYLFQIVNSVGGEGAELNLDEGSSLLISQLLSKVAKLEKDLLNIENPDQSMFRAKILKVENELNNINQIIAPVTQLLSKIAKLEKDFLNIEHPDQSMVKANISNIEKELANLDISSNITTIMPRLDIYDKGLFDLNQLISSLFSHNTYIRSTLVGAIKNTNDRRYALLVS